MALAASQSLGFGLAFVLALGAFVGSERAASRQVSPARITVTYWEKWTGAEEAAIRRIVDKYNASQSHVYVRLLSISDVAGKTLLATSGGNPPDIAGLWADQVVQFSDAGALTDLTDMARAAGIRSTDYIPSYWSEMTYKGRIYAFPTTPGTDALYVNRDLMPPEYDSPEKFPKTLNEFGQLVAKVTKKDKDGHLKVAGFIPRESTGAESWPYLFGGAYFKDGVLKVDRPENVRAWEWAHSFAADTGMQEMQSFRSGFGNYSSPENPFLAGKLACRVDGPWFADFINLYNPKVRWFAVPFPYPDDRPDCKSFAVLNLNALLIPRGARHPKEAFDFIRFVQRQDNMEQLCHDQYCNSPLSNVSEAFFDHHPNPYIRLFDALARSPRAVAVEKTGIASQISQEIDNASDEMDLGRKTPEQALEDAQARLSQAWTKYQRQVLGR